MYGGTLGVISAKAGWTETLDIRDEETGEPIDLTGCTVTVTIEDGLCNGTSVVGGTTTGQVTLPSLGLIEIVLPPSSFTNLDPGPCRVGITVSRDGETTQLLMATLVVEEGL